MVAELEVIDEAVTDVTTGAAGGPVETEYVPQIMSAGPTIVALAACDPELNRFL
jgi:hypothetical protein